ncbi:MAG: undecaprenyl/decaprenyl-phosphate alpha-N-acetylglucosaminyl 1-phosphate transferase [Planctomycetes bacterium]|nr:undecaprenyl/decaprenyl-phosphate alpha-N-acetylglucosaminyl 1-phosphate transferase [Planctomycetota bacterium]
MLLAYAIVFCLAFTAAVLLAPVVRLLAVRIGAIDRPDGKRKIHTKPTPRLGGLVITAAILLAVGAYIAMDPGIKALIFTSPTRVAGFLAGLVIILGLGIWDDIKGVRPRTKVLFQTLAVVVCFAAGYRINVPFVARGTYTFLSFPLTWLWLVACINAMNLVDGMDGLASGVAFFAGAVILVLAAVYGKISVALAAAAMLGSVVGFLMYNFHPAVMFLGDSGSLLLGYLVAILAMAASLKSHATVALLIPILALGLPIMDTLLAVLRRWSRRLPISQADREHIHHRLLGLGFSDREAVVVLYAACLALAAAALAVAAASSFVVGLILGLLCILAVAAVHLVGAGELAVFLRRIGESLRVPGRERVDSAAKKTTFWLKHSRSPEEVAKALEPYLRALPASGVELREPGAAGKLFMEVKWEETGGAGCIKELFRFPSGRELLLVVEGVDGAASRLPDEVRRELKKVLGTMEGGKREPDIAAAPEAEISGNAPVQ